MQEGALNYILFYLNKLIQLKHIKLCYLLLFIAITNVSAQNAIFSLPVKSINKIKEYEIIGRTEQGILIRKWGNGINLFEMYDVLTMKLIWAKTLILSDKKADLLKIISCNNELIVIYKIKRKKEIFIYAKKITNNLEPITQEQLLYTTSKNKATQATLFDVITSVNKNYFLLKKHNYNYEGLYSIETVLCNKNLEVIEKKQFAINNKASLISQCLDINGVFSMAVANYKRQFLSNKNIFESIEIKSYNYKTAQESNLLINNSNNYYYNNFKITPNNLTNNLVVVGFYSEKQNNAPQGFFSVIINTNNLVISQQNYQPFDAKLLQQISNKNIIKNNLTNINNLQLDTIILKKDNGMLLLSEVIEVNFRQEPTRDAIGVVGGGRLVSIADNFYGDVVAILINNEGVAEWNGVLRKKQYSQDDEGYFSSIGIVNLRNSINLVFNEEITNHSIFSRFEITKETGYKMTGIFNNNEFNLIPAPRYGKQISDTEYLMPAFNTKNELLLVKLKF